MAYTQTLFYQKVVVNFLQAVLKRDFRDLSVDDESNKQSMTDLLNNEYARPPESALIKLQAGLQKLLDQYVTSATISPAAAHEDITKRGVDFCTLTQRGVIVDLEKLKFSYAESRIDKNKAMLRIEFVLPDSIVGFGGELPSALMKRILALAFGSAYTSKSAFDQHDDALSLLRGLLRIREGSTVLEFIVDPRLAKDLETAFEAGSLAGVVTDFIITYAHPVSEREYPDLLPDPDEQCRKSWQRARRGEARLRPWRRLRWLYSPSIATSSLCRVFAESDRRAYASVEVSKDYPALRNDLFMSWILWPALTTVLLLIALLALKIPMPDISILGGILGGILMAIAGGQVCAALVSPLAAGAAAIPVGWSFGLALAVVIGRFDWLGSDEARKDLALAVIGGPLGQSAPNWPGNLPAAMIAAMLMAIAGAIAVAGWVIAQPKIAAASEYSTVPWSVLTRRRDALARGEAAPSETTGEGRRPNAAVGGMLGFLTGGAGIGATYGAAAALTRLGLSSTTAFLIGFAIVGGGAFATMIGSRRTRPSIEALPFAAALVLALCVAGYLATHVAGLAGIVFLSIAFGLFHAVWFGAAHCVGAVSSVRAAVIATTLQGALGFTGFLVFQMLHGPWRGGWSGLHG